MKTSELTGAALDWAVAKCEGGVGENQLLGAWYAPSTDWAQGGPIIEREGLTVVYSSPSNPPVTWFAETFDGRFTKAGPTPLIAAMRCYVASKLGDITEVPQELLGV